MQPERSRPARFTGMARLSFVCFPYTAIAISIRLLGRTRYIFLRIFIQHLMSHEQLVQQPTCDIIFTATAERLLTRVPR